MTQRPVLDYRPRHDERSRAYRISAPDPALLRQSRFWTPGAVVTDQGSEGACVGHGVVNEAMASPVRVPFPRSTFIAVDGQFMREADYVAQQVYRRAQQIDEWEGEQYDGTSVLAGMKVGRERGWWRSFGWAFNLSELRAGLESGPVIVGVEWREAMYEAPDGVVTVDGPVAGGHCLVITGYTRHHRIIGGPAYRWRNSWGGATSPGGGYGLNGSAYIAAADLDRVLFQAGGEAAVPVERAA